MKVIKKGRAQKGWAKEIACSGKGNGGGGCGAMLLVEKSDLFQTAHHSYDGSSDYYVTFACAACGVLTDIEGYPEGAHGLPTRGNRSAWD